jgi:hypothetical protein
MWCGEGSGRFTRRKKSLRERKMMMVLCSRIYLGS